MKKGSVQHAHDRGMHMLGATAYGWSALERGGLVARRDVNRHAPPLAANLRMGRMMRPVLDPIASRDRRLPLAARTAMGVGAGGLALLLLRRLFGRS